MAKQNERRNWDCYLCEALSLILQYCVAQRPMVFLNVHEVIYCLMNFAPWQRSVPFMPADLFARGLVAAALAPPNLDNGLPIWNIAPPSQQMTVAQAVLRAANACGAPPPLFGKHLPADQRSYNVDGRRFARAYPNVPYLDDFDSQISQTVAAFSKLPTLAKDIIERRFIRLQMLREITTQSAMAELSYAI